MTDARCERVRRHAVVLTAAAVILAGCASGTSDAGSGTSAAPTSVATTVAPTSETATAAPAPTVTPGSTGEPSGEVVEVPLVVREGRVSPLTHRVKITVGQMVRLRVTSDTADDVHVHGYNQKVEVQPGTQAMVEFVADQSGLFEVELEDAGLQLVQLEVR